MSKKVVEQEETVVIDRSPELIAAEIRSIDQQAKQFFLHSAIEIGRRLNEAKDLVDHGEWKQWLKDNVNYSQSTAINFMRISEEYAGSEAFGNLSYTQAVALLSVPAEEREQFVEENNASEMSSRELQAAIKEKKRLEEQLREQEEKAAKFDEWAEKQAQERKELQARLDREKELRENHEQTLQKLQEELKTAGEDKASAKLKAELRSAEKKVSDSQKRVTESEDKLKQMEADMEAKVAEKVKEREKELADEAKKRETATAQQIAELQEKLRKNNNTAAIQVKVRFEQLTSSFKELFVAISQLENEERRKAIQGRIAELCDQMKSQC